MLILSSRLACGHLLLDCRPVERSVVMTKAYVPAVGPRRRRAFRAELGTSRATSIVEVLLNPPKRLVRIAPSVLPGIHIDGRATETGKRRVDQYGGERVVVQIKAPFCVGGGSTQLSAMDASRAIWSTESITFVVVRAVQ